MSQSAKCAKCDEDLPVNPRMPCPKCGSTERKHSIMLNEKITLKDSLTVTRKSKREYLEKHPKILVIVVLVTFGSPIVGFVLGFFFSGIVSGVIGLVLGSVCGLLGFWLTPQAVIKVRLEESETTHG